MRKGRFLNQKLGKRMSRRFDLLKSQLAGKLARFRADSRDARLPKKGSSGHAKTHDR